MLGNKLIYLESGSGAINSANTDTISLVKQNLTVPLIVGGGVNTAKTALNFCKAGADIIVLGTIMESDTIAMQQICEKIKSFYPNSTI